MKLENSKFIPLGMKSLHPPRESYTFKWRRKKRERGILSLECVQIPAGTYTQEPTDLSCYANPHIPFNHVPCLYHLLQLISCHPPRLLVPSAKCNVSHETYQHKHTIYTLNHPGRIIFFVKRTTFHPLSSFVIRTYIKVVCLL